jgi:hypothetical protein
MNERNDYLNPAFDATGTMRGQIMAMQNVVVRFGVKALQALKLLAGRATVLGAPGAAAALSIMVATYGDVHSAYSTSAETTPSVNHEALSRPAASVLGPRVPVLKT